MDKIQKIREEVERMHSLLPVMDGDNISVNYADRICTTLEMYIDSLQEEPVSRTPADIEAAMQEVEEKSKAFTDAHQGENTDTILAQMRGEELVSEDLEQFATEYAEAHHVSGKSEFAKAVKIGANWQKEQMMAKAFDFTKEHNTACVLASECLRNHGWFNRERVFNDLFRHLSCVDKLFEGKFSGKTKVIVIKED